MKIQCIKIPKYKTKLSNNKATFKYVSMIAIQEADPDSDAKESLFFDDNSIVFHSTLNRSRQSLNKKCKSKFIASKALNEVPFDIQKMCTFEEWNAEGSTVVRRMFKEGFIKDTLLISREEIFKEIKSLFTSVQKIKNKKIFFISHSFKLKIIEAFVKTQGEVIRKPELIEDYIFDNKKTFDFGEEFIINISQLN